MGTYYTYKKVDSLEVYGRECYFRDKLLWWPRDDFEERWTEEEIKRMLASNEILLDRCPESETVGENNDEED